jgi:hypothetical protein
VIVSSNRVEEEKKEAPKTQPLPGKLPPPAFLKKETSEPV